MEFPSENRVECLEKIDMQEKHMISPFMKSSPIWKTIESMEIFEVIPQNPHFLPLETVQKNAVKDWPEAI